MQHVGFMQPEVERRYAQYMADMHGDVSDLPRLCEVMWNAGGRHALMASREVADIVPLLGQLERRTARLRAIFESFADNAEVDLEALFDEQVPF
jgi:hypothetical protein